MAKVKAEINKSEEIRKLFAANPGATGKEIVAKLKEQGIVVSEGLVYSCKPGKKKKGAKGKAKTAPSANGASSVGESIAVAKAAAEKIGGWSALKEIVDALQKQRCSCRLIVGWPLHTMGLARSLVYEFMSP